MFPGILPRHIDLQLVSTGTTATTRSHHDNTDKGFQAPPILGTGITASSTAQSTYQYYLTGGNTLVQVNDFLDLGDVELVDYVPGTDTLAALDAAVLNISIYVSDALDVLDAAFASDADIVDQEQELLGYGDEVSVGITLSLSDPLTVVDTLSISVAVPVQETIATQDSAAVSIYLTLRDTVKVEIAQLVTQRDSVNVTIGQMTLAASTDYAAAGNPIKPTITSNGVYLNQHPETDVGAPGHGVTVSYLDDSFIDGFGCNMKDMTLSLTKDTGSWNAVTTEFIGLSGPLTVLGFPSQITWSGYSDGDAGNFYLTDGEIGASRLNDPVQQYAQEYSQLRGVIVSQDLATPSSDKWTTAVVLAQFLAAKAGISLAWLAQDVPIQDVLPESGGQVRDAINSLANRVGAEFIYGGSTQYWVLYPDQYIGEWVIPDCSLILAEGLKQQDRVYLPSYQALLWPQEEISRAPSPDPVFTGDVIFPPPPPPIYPIGSLNTRLTESSPAALRGLPPDYDIVYAQIITPSDPSGTYVTLDQTGNTWSQWGGQIITKEDGTRWIRVTHADLPPDGDNEDIEAGNWSMNFGCTKKTEKEEEQFRGGQQEGTSRKSTVLRTEQEALRFVQTRRGSLSCVFFGSVPLVGMHFSTTVNGRVYEGRIESVNISLPGYVSITYALWKRLNFYQNRQTLSIANLERGS
jgi:hypothetical protein